MPYLFALLPLVLSIVTLADLITRRDDQVKHLNKTFWIIIVILVPLVGSLLWWAVGREYERVARPTMSFGDPRRIENVSPASTPGVSQTELELARLDAEIAQAEVDARLRRLERELSEKKGEQGAPDQR